MKTIQILGIGCPKCEKLRANAESAAKESGIDCRIEKVTSLDEITRFGVMMTPALAIDGVVVTSGSVPDVSTIRRALTEAG